MIELGQVGKREERKKYWYRLSTDNSTIVASAAVHPDFYLNEVFFLFQKN